MRLDEITSVGALRRTHGRSWDEVLEPILRDTSGVTAKTPFRLDALTRMVGALIRELGLHPLPELMIYVPPQDRDVVDSWTFASMLVVHRAERLVQAAELLAGTLSALEGGSLQLSAVASRALLELSVVCWDIHQKLMVPWRKVHGSVRRVRAEARSASSATYQVLWQTRMGSRLLGYRAAGWPEATNIMTRVGRLAKEVPRVQEVYEALCDSTHPSVESQATLWRSGTAAVQHRKAIEFAPGRSDSPVKIDTVEAAGISITLLLPFVRDLWWIAADITNTCDITPNDRTRVLALPARTGRHEWCSCGSGRLTATCDHPEPHFGLEEIGWPAPFASDPSG